MNENIVTAKFIRSTTVLEFEKLEEIVLDIGFISFLGWHPVLPLVDVDELFCFVPLLTLDVGLEMITGEFLVDLMFF